MAGLFVQDVVVALVAAGALALVLRRLVGVAAAPRTPTCGHCAPGACAPAGPVSPRSGDRRPTDDRSVAGGRSAAAGTHPLVVVRPPRP